MARADIEFGTTPKLLAHAAATRGDAPAIHDGDVVVSWAELERVARRAAAAYVAAGVAPGDRVAIWAPNVLGVDPGRARHPPRRRRARAAQHAVQGRRGRRTSSAAAARGCS